MARTHDGQVSTDQESDALPTRAVNGKYSYS